VLINGASGSVGHFAVQIAKALGAEVSGACSTAKQDLVRSLGADHVIDYMREDVTRSGRRFDRILDIRAHHSIIAYRRALNPAGIYAGIGGASGSILLQAVALGPLLSKTGDRQMGVVIHRPFKPEDVMVVKELVTAGKLAPVIDKSYQLHEVADALRYVDAGHARGKVVITVRGACPR
jgi:NADPH:quinone reductase-like Zn-dependent oxidoreductase